MAAVAFGDGWLPVSNPTSAAWPAPVRGLPVWAQSSRCGSRSRRRCPDFSWFPNIPKRQGVESQRRFSRRPRNQHPA